MGRKALDLVGQRFGKLTVQQRVQNKGKNSNWLCVCDCGNTTEVVGHSLSRGYTKTCGCGTMYKDITGQLYGKRVALSFVEYNENQGAMWLVRCECGEESVISRAKLKNTKSCGKCKKKKDLTGTRIGFLDVLYETDSITFANKGKQRVWTCLCDCGKVFDVIQTNLTNSNYPTRSCGCRNPNKPNPRYAKVPKKHLDYAKLMWSKFNMLWEDFLTILENQDYSCGICNTPFETIGGRKMHLDHCHETEKVRGILCASCNTALGKLGDNAQGLRKALAYLENS